MGVPSRLGLDVGLRLLAVTGLGFPKVELTGVLVGLFPELALVGLTPAAVGIDGVQLVLLHGGVFLFPTQRAGSP